MTVREAENWQRFFKIRGPAGDKRLDINFAYLRQTLLACHVEKPPAIDECVLKFDYKNHFSKDVESVVEEMVNNIEADIAAVMALGARIKRQQE
jgi:hypothetical protein